MPADELHRSHHRSRPNVGKSTLSTPAGRKLALVDDTLGDLAIAAYMRRLYDIDFDVIDTAGFEDALDHCRAACARADRGRHP